VKKMMNTISEVIAPLENFAPAAYQESYDNVGLQIGRSSDLVKSVLLCLEITEEVVDEAVLLGANLIICHHPLIFGGLKSVTGRNSVEKTVIKCIKNDIAVFVAHTNIDNNSRGVSFKMAEKLDLQDVKPLITYKGQLFKLVTFVPHSHIAQVRNAIFEAGAGSIGNYNSCSFNISGEGTFKAMEGATPFVGKVNELHTEPETRIETIFPKHLEQKVLHALLSNHPYEEVAYDIYPLNNDNPLTGAGAIGTLKEEEDEESFFIKVKDVFGCKAVRHSNFLNKKIKKVALCGGSGYSFLKNAIYSKSDVYITADIKYHQFSEAENKIIIADIGHYESEQFILEVFYEILIKNFSKFAVYFTKVNTNPINYF
jgi:dinuclear metal center YbgI/SA1388 family protein